MPHDIAQHSRSVLERLPTWLICIPLTVQWLGLTLRYGSATLPSVANPNITAGGLVGEGKLEYFQAMGSTAQATIARHFAIHNTNSYSIADLQQQMISAGLSFPVIAKPNLGLCGYGVRLVVNIQELSDYLHTFPVDEVVVIQEYLPDDGEAGVFYARHPNEAHGQIIGLTLRHYPQVIGDGKSSISELIQRNPRAQRLFRSQQHQCNYPTDDIPAEGQVVRLATIGSTRVGGLYQDGARYITPPLTQAFDAIARDMPHFYFGRFDVRFSSLAELSNGQQFKIMEINGAGSEAIQAWDPDTSLFRAFRIIFAKQRLLFAIAAANRAKGYRPISLWRLARLHFRQRKLIKYYPPSN